MTPETLGRPEVREAGGGREMTNEEMNDLYLIQDSRSYVGNSILWWRPDGKGYTTDFDDAGRYTAERAFSQHRSRPTDVPWKLSEIEPLIAPRQIQRLPRPVHLQSRAITRKRNAMKRAEGKAGQ